MNTGQNIRLALLLVCTVTSALLTTQVFAAKPVFEIVILNHLFEPSTLEIPAYTKVKIIVHNKDTTPEEFESYELNREKVILGGQKASIFVGPLEPGEYPFFGEFHPNTALGKIIVVEKP